jgi:hypothetical protein
MLRHFPPEAIAHPVILALTERTGSTSIAPIDYRGTGLLGHDGEMGTARYRSGEARNALEARCAWYVGDGIGETCERGKWAAWSNRWL